MGLDADGVKTASCFFWDEGAPGVFRSPGFEVTTAELHQKGFAVAPDRLNDVKVEWEARMLRARMLLSSG